MKRARYWGGRYGCASQERITMAEMDTAGERAFWGSMTDAAGEVVVKDSGQRRIFESGMQRDIDDDKVNWALVADGPMLRRWAEHLTKGAKKYDARNWMKANGQAELDRFRESAFRHFMQLMEGDTTEDHAAA